MNRHRWEESREIFVVIVFVKRERRIPRNLLCKR